MMLTKKARVVVGAGAVYLLLWLLTALVGTSSARRHVLGIIHDTIPADVRGRYVEVDETKLEAAGHPEYWYFATAFAPCPFIVHVRCNIYAGWAGRYYVLWLFGYDHDFS